MRNIFEVDNWSFAIKYNGFNSGYNRSTKKLGFQGQNIDFEKGDLES